VIGYVATVKATQGAYPRKLSGHLRRSITYQYMEYGDVQLARVGTNVQYGKWLELSRGRGDHEWLVVTMVRIRRELAYIMGGAQGSQISGFQSNTP
jgi:phage gpG-like protein